MRTLRDNMKTWPQILIEYGKHDNEFWYIADEAALHRAAIKIVAARVKCGYIRPPGDGPEGLQEEVPAEMLARLPKAMQEQAKRTKERNAYARREYATAVKLWVLAQRAQDGDGAAAWELLRERRDHEYERVELVTPEVP